MGAHVFWCVLLFGKHPGFLLYKGQKEIKRIKGGEVGVLCCLLFLLSCETGLDIMLFCLLH